MRNEFRENRQRNRRINLARVIETAKRIAIFSVPLFIRSLKLYNRYQLHKALLEQEKLLQELKINKVQKKDLDLAPKVAPTKNSDQKVVELDLLGRTSQTAYKPNLRKRVQRKEQQTNNQCPKL